MCLEKNSELKADSPIAFSDHEQSQSEDDGKDYSHFIKKKGSTNDKGKPSWSAENNQKVPEGEG